MVVCYGGHRSVLGRHLRAQTHAGSTTRYAAGAELTMTSPYLPTLRPYAALEYVYHRDGDDGPVAVAITRVVYMYCIITPPAALRLRLARPIP